MNTISHQRFITDFFKPASNANPTIVVIRNAEEGSITNRVDNPTQGYIRHPVAGDGDCGYVAFGVTRSVASNLLRDNVSFIREIIQLPVEEALVTEEFYSYLHRQNLLSAPHQQIINNDVFRVQFATDLAVQIAYIQYDVDETHIDAGWAHPKILQALAHIRGIELHMKALGNDGALIPHRMGDQDYSVYRPPVANQRVDLLFVNGNHFDRLEYKGYGNDIPEQGVYPLNSSWSGKEHDFKPPLYKHCRDYRQSRIFLKRHRYRYDAAITHHGYFFCASANFTEYHVYTTTDQVIFVNNLKKYVPSNTLVAHAKVDSDSALEHISVDAAFRRQGIGTTLIRFINKCDTQFYVYSGIEHNSRYRLTCEGAALIRACVQKGILKEEQVILGVPESPASFSPYRS